MNLVWTYSCHQALTGIARLHEGKMAGRCNWFLLFLVVLLDITPYHAGTSKCDLLEDNSCHLTKVSSSRTPAADIYRLEDYSTCVLVFVEHNYTRYFISYSKKANF